MGTNPDSRRETIRALTELRQKQDETVEKASNFWGSINEELGARLLMDFERETRVQSYVLTCRGSRLDLNGVDAVLHLWDQSFMPLNFKSSEGGKRHHEEVYGKRIPALVVNQAADPKLVNARSNLLRLIDTWYGNFPFDNSMLIPCARLHPKSKEIADLKEEITNHLNVIQTSGGIISAKDGTTLRISSILSVAIKRREYGYVSANILLAGGPHVAFEFYRGNHALTWVGKKNTALVVLAEGTTTANFREALAAGIQKTRKI